jgi:hypothetical protein
MARSADQPQKRNTGGTKRANTGSTSYSDTTGRDSRATEDDWLSGGELASDPPRSNTTAIRRTNLPVPRNPTAGLPNSPSPIPQRRTGQGQPRQPAASLSDPITIKSPMRGPTKPQSPPKKNIFAGKVHWLLPLGIGMIAMLVLWEVGSLALAWGLARYDDLRYGIPRTYQVNAVVGHGGDSAQHPSHFIAVNLNRQAIVVEFPAGSQAGALSYVVPYYILGPGGDLTPITLEFRDVTGDGKPDMIIHIHLQSQDQTFVFVNDGTKFRPPTAKDNIHL